jgi:PPP family 3-phenylpropionic acid transporter
MPAPTISLQHKPSLAALRLYYFGSLGALGAYLPFFPRWLEARGVRGVAQGVILAAVPAMNLLAPPAFGFLADVLGARVRLLRLACAGACLVFSLLTLAAALGLELGFVTLLVAALSFAFFRAPMVQMADVVALELSAGGSTSYGSLRLWGSLGFALMAMAAGAWIDPAHPAQLPGVTAAALLTAFAISLSLPSSPAPRGEGLGAERGPAGALRERVGALLRARDFRFFLAASFLAQSAHVAYDVCFSRHMSEIGVSRSMIGVFWAVGVFAEILLMALSGRLLARVSPPTLLAVGFVGASLRWALLASVRSFPVLIAIQPLHAVSFGLVWISSLAYTRERAPPQILATAQGLFTATVGAGSVLGMLVWSELHDRAGGALTFGAASAVASLAFVLAVRFARSARFAAKSAGVKFFSAGVAGRE